MAGLCEPWITVEDISECCPDLVGSDLGLFDDSASASSDALFEFSGRQYPGLCERTIRPCTSPKLCGVQQLSRGHIVSWDGHFWTTEGGVHGCDCGGVSRVELLNEPVREILQVILDGEVLDASEYRLDGYKWLTRLRDTDGNRQSWPRCQSLDLADDDEGAFAVTYLHGTEAPALGQSAAAELACQIYQACPGVDSDPGDCLLPSGTVRIVSQGLTIELDKLRAWGWDAKRGWHTGMPLVDLFLNSKNPNGLHRPPLIVDPAEAYAEEVGNTLST